MENKLATYSEKITSEQVCKLLHISKRKCSWMLQHGMIPCEDTGKQTRRYTIYLADVLTFKADYEAHPDRYFIPQLFTADSAQPKKRLPYYLAPEEIPADFRPWLDDEWYDLADVLSPKEIELLLGYDTDSVRRWLNRGWLRSIKAQGTEVIAREWLIDFMCDYAFRIAKKSEMHMKLLDKYFSEKTGFDVI